jgi:hypothetical protein
VNSNAPAIILVNTIQSVAEKKNTRNISSVPEFKPRLNTDEHGFKPQTTPNTRTLFPIVTKNGKLFSVPEWFSLFRLEEKCNRRRKFFGVQVSLSSGEGILKKAEELHLAIDAA